MNKLATYVAIATLSLIAAPSFAAEDYNGVTGTVYNRAIICNHPETINLLGEVIIDLQAFDMDFRQLEARNQCVMIDPESNTEIRLKKAWGPVRKDWDGDSIENWIVHDMDGRLAYALIWPSMALGTDM